MRRAAATVGLLLLATPCRPEVVVRVSGARVDLSATAAPLAEVLDRLARQTGMKVVYEGAAPRQLVTLSLHARTPEETVLAVLEGQGLNFAMVTDTAGGGVSTLVLAGAPGASPPASARPTDDEKSRRAPFNPPPGASPDAMEPSFDEDPSLEEMPEEVPFSGVPPGSEGIDPAVAFPQGPGEGQVPPGAFPGAGTQPFPPQQSYPVSPFAPQAQPFPALPPGVTPGMPMGMPVPGGPPPEAGSAPGSVPPP